MNVLVRTDASVALGHGHAMRCLTLAAGLRELRASVSFVCRELPGHLCDFIAERGFPVRRIPAAVQSWQADAEHTRTAVDECAADWLVVDHYSLDARWERCAAPDDDSMSVMVIDDLADRPHDCDLLLDQNYFPDAARRYSGLVPVHCTRFLGPEYVLLRDEFRKAARSADAKRERRLLIFFGGGDPGGQSEQALAAALEFASDLPIDVILGSNNPNADAIAARYGGRPNVRLHKSSNEMAKLMARASLCLGAGGIATFERIYMELPSIVVSTAPNQREPLAALADLGCLDYLGDAEQIGRAQWVAALRRWHASPRQPAPLPVATRTERVLAAFDVRLTPFAERHIAGTFEFLKDRALRAAFAMEGEIEWSAHVAYWQRKLAADTEKIFAIERGGEHVGNCGIKPMPSGGHEGWIYLAPTVDRRSGLGEIAFRRLMRIAFRTLRLERLYLHVLADNAAALSLYEKLGFEPAAELVDAAVWGERSAEVRKMVIAP